MKDIERALLEAVGAHIAADGFESKPLSQSFFRRFPAGRASLHLAFIKHPRDFDVVADVAVRFHELEDLISANNALLSKKEKGQTYSLGAELGNIAGEGQMRWNVASSADVNQVADRLVAAFKAIGLPYLDRAATLEGAYKLLTSPGRDAWLHSPIHASRAKRIVGLAKILGRADEVSVRARENLLLLEDIKDLGLQDFMRFVANLGVNV
jgi:hypothetical protein